MTFEVRVDCPACRVEGARIEAWDETPSCRLGVPSTVCCKLCGLAGEGRVAGFREVAPGDGCPGCGTPIDDAIRDAHRCPFCGASATLEATNTARPFASVDERRQAFDTWARDEGLGTTEELIEAYFVLSGPTEVFAAMARGEIIETTFDVADYLFSSGPSAGGATAEPAVIRDDAPITHRTVPPPSIRRPGSPRDELLALASVAAADGEANADDQAVLVRAAGKRGMPPLAAEDIRVWRPNEIGPPPTLVDRERVLEEMFQMAWADGQMDPSELRVIRDYARAWGIDPQRVREWTELYTLGDANAFERWMRRIGLFLFPAR